MASTDGSSVTVNTTSSSNTEGAIAGSSPASTGLTGGSGIGLNPGSTNGIGLNAGSSSGTLGIASQNASSGSASVAGTTTATSPNTVKQITQTSIVPNPLDAYASSTYGISLWWLGLQDFDLLTAQRDVSATSWNPTTANGSYVVAEDSGLYPQSRVPGWPFNYNIDRVNFTTTIAHSEQGNTSNIVSGTLTIIEPYGITFIESLLTASALTPGDNFTMHPFLLQIDFFGYDDNGDLMSQSVQNTLRKQCPIQLTKSKIDLTANGTEYTFTFAPYSEKGHDEIRGKIPQVLSVVAGTVNEFFNGPQGLAAQLNAFYINDQKTAQNAVLADQYEFLIDPSIASGTLGNPASRSLGKSDPNSSNVDISKANFTFSAGTSILTIIDQVFSQSSFLTQTQLNLGPAPQMAGNQTTPVNLIKTQVAVKLQGARNSPDTVVTNTPDIQRNQYPVLITYSLHQYPNYQGKHPAVGSLPDSRPITVKDYQYMYTGKNTAIIDLKLNFNMSYYTAVLGYTNSVAASQATQLSAASIQLQAEGATKITAPVLAAGGVAGLNNVQTVNPPRYGYLVGDRNKTIGAGLVNDSSSQTGADVLKSVRDGTNGDMVNIKMTIVGDPTFIKQDDWLYIVDPTNDSSIYNQWDTMSQADFAAQTGHMRMDVGEVVVAVTVNTPIDNDTDITNMGLVYPIPGSRQSTFSGQYRVIQLKNSFEAGSFTQELHLARYIPDDYVVGGGAELQNSATTTGANNLTSTGLTQAEYVAAIQSLQSQSGTWKANPENFNATQIAIQTLTQQYNQQFRGQ
jgi:hypothetical protein